LLLVRLVSACLVGVNCRYDGGNSLDERVMGLVSCCLLVPVCPEQLGGLGTPRQPMRIVGGSGGDVLDGKARVVNKSGEDVTRNLVVGAEEVLRIARLLGVRTAILKAGSPSCGCGEIRDSGIPRRGDGVTTALLKRNGIRVVTEEELGRCGEV